MGAGSGKDGNECQEGDEMVLGRGERLVSGRKIPIEMIVLKIYRNMGQKLGSNNDDDDDDDEVKRTLRCKINVRINQR